MGTVDPRVIKTLRSIDAALLENLRERSFDKITIDNICKSAMINRSTFYKYYEDKYSLLNSYLDRIVREFQKEMKTDFILAEPSRIDDNFYQHLFADSVKYMTTQKDLYTFLWNLDIDRALFFEMTDALHDNILGTMTGNHKLQEGSKEYRYLDLYAYFFASNTMNLIYWWFRNYDHITFDDVLYIMTNNMKTGMFTTLKKLL